MFFDISSRLIPKVHMFYSMFIDVMSFADLTDPDKNINHWSMQGGMRLSNLLPNTNLTLEYIRNNPLVYKNDPQTLYASNWYNIGHYLNDNAREIYAAIDYKPYRTLNFNIWYSLSQKGPNLPYIRTKDPETGYPMIYGRNFMEFIDWEQQLLGARISYQPINDLFVFIEAEKANRSGNFESYNSDYYQGNTITWSFGLNYGFY